MRSIDEIRASNSTPDDWVHRPIVALDGQYFYEEPDRSLTPCNWDGEEEDCVGITT